MATTNTFYARPVYMTRSKDAPLQNHIGADPKSSRNMVTTSSRTNRKLPIPEPISNARNSARVSHGRKLPHTESLGTGKPSETQDRWQRKTSSNTTLSTRSSRKLPDPEIISNCVNVQSRIRKLSDIENTDPPPRPPPPRPSRVPKRQENIRSIITSGPTKYTPDGLAVTPKSSRVSDNHEQLNHVSSTPEPKPLTRTNVTQHDGIWQKSVEENSGPTDILSPPLKYITPQITEEMLRNFNPLDHIDSTSEHSDSSADTMIMMTTEEEKRNLDKINHSLNTYNQIQTQADQPSTDTGKQSMQNKKNRHIHFSDTNGYVDIQTLDKSIAMSSNHATSSKITPLHVTTENGNASSPESNKNSGVHTSPNADSPDDGYGTNSSSGTVSSPFSSSFNSVVTDFEHASNASAGGPKQAGLPNGAIRPNSVRESWAVKRKQRMIEAQDNSLQEQLRQLTIIQEEGGAAAMSKNARKLRANVNLLRKDIAQRDNKIGKTDYRAEEPDNESAPINLSEFSRTAVSDSDPPYVNVSQSEIAHRNRQLYVIDSDNTELKTRSRTLPATFSVRSASQHTSSNEINVPPPRVPPHRHVTGTNLPYSSTVSAERIYDQVYESRNSVNVANRPTVHQNSTRMEEFRPVSIAESDSDASLVLRGGSGQLQTRNGSGNIYVSAAGDEGFYSLNRSVSGSVVSFEPIAEQEDHVDGPQSPLDSLNGENFEKWSDMDRNYRNYSGFEDNYHRTVGDDSKVNYFQEKKLKNVYGHDNYYQPQGYGPGTVTEQDLRELVARQQTVVEPPEGQGSRTSSMSHKSSASTSSKSSKLFHILPNMFKPSHKKQNTDKVKGKSKGVPVTTEPVVPSPVVQEQVSLDLEQEPEYVNMSDLPQYSMANLKHEGNLKKGQFTSVDNLHKRPVFASSKDIQKLFSLQDQSFDSINHPGSQRHSFHAVPLSYRYVNREPNEQSTMRPRAQSTSATMRSQQGRDSIERRMEVLHRKNAQMNQVQQNVSAANSIGNLSTNSSNAPSRASRTRLNSGSSGELSTLV